MIATSRQIFPERAEHESVEFSKSTDPVSSGPLNHPHNTNIENRQALIATKVAAVYLEGRLNISARQIKGWVGTVEAARGIRDD